MDHWKRYAALLFWTILAIDGQRWYSANFYDHHQPKPPHFGPQKPVYRPFNYVQDYDKYLPVEIMINDSKSLTESMSVIKLDRRKETKFPFLYKHLNKTLQKENNIDKSYAGALSYKHSNSSKIRPTVKINRSITNVNIIRKPSTKPYLKPRRRLVRKCPTGRPRQKKQLDPNQTLQKRFLEVFEVVQFDHVPCTASSGLEGVCLPEFECQIPEGTPMGTCADGFGTCCVTQSSCDGQSAAASGWFVNPGFPSPSTERLSCVFTLYKSSPDIQQLRLDFTNFELLAPSAGTCEQDQFMVTGQNVNNFMPILCGVNTGQHMYVEVGDVDGPISFSVQTVSSDTRLFAIKITQLTSDNDLAAPAGCLQYFRGPQGYLESFNYRDKSDIAIARKPSYLNNLNYAMCIERASGTCSVTYTNTGNMQIVNYDSDGLPVLPPQQAGVEIFNCPTDWLLAAAVRLCGDRLNDGSVLQDFALDAPVTDIGAGPIVVSFRSDGGYVGRGFKLQYQQNDC